ncbi:MAG: hypothetical protein ABSH29_22980 [Acidimicrobiales bacterium]
MKLPQRPESTSGQFEGRTPAEAVQLARVEFGHDAPVRCWKTRSGGVLGFFAREAFVAGISPPAGAIKAVKTPRPAKEPKEVRAAVPHELPPPSPDRATGAKLVEDTSDEVTLGSAQVPAAVFSEVLAEAQAAVNGTDLVVRPPWPAPVDAMPVLASPEWIDGLNDSLARIGVPRAFRPNRAEATLDGLAVALAMLPAAPKLPTEGGSVIVVVGAGRDAQAAARALLARLGLEASDLLTVDRTDAGRQRVTRRRSSNKVTVLVVDASLRSRSLTAVAPWIEQVKPDHVIGAVPATAKRSDVEHWRAQVGHVDALAVSRLGDTSSPGELMGLLPIAFLDGEEASTLRWVLTLLRAKLEREP